MTERFETIVRQACITEQELRAMANSPRMSIEAIVAECVKRAGSTLETLTKLRELLTTDPVRFRHSKAFVRQAMGWFSKGLVNTGVPGDVRRMALPSRDDAILELTGSKFGIYLLWGIAAMNAHAKNPTAFGAVTDTAAWRKRYEELKMRRDVLLVRISQEFMPSDTDVGEPGSDGRAFISFKLSQGRVPIAPLNNAGMRLVNSMLDSRPEWITRQPVDLKVKRQRVATG